MAKSKHETREQWLVAAVDMLRPVFKARAKVTIPAKVRISCGFPQGTRGKGKNTAIGQCWSKVASKDGAIEMFISPTIADSARVLDITTHELVHAGVGIKEGHNKVFGAAARAMLLEGKLTATTGGDAFKKEIAAPILKALGQYPHAALVPGGDSTGPKKQGTRLLKCHCPECGYTARVTQKWLTVAALTCPNEECDAYQSEMTVG
jgi:hypothetical protein